MSKEKWRKILKWKNYMYYTYSAIDRFIDRFDPSPTRDKGWAILGIKLFYATIGAYGIGGVYLFAVAFLWPIWTIKDINDMLVVWAVGLLLAYFISRNTGFGQCYKEDSEEFCRLPRHVRFLWYVASYGILVGAIVIFVLLFSVDLHSSD